MAGRPVGHVDSMSAGHTFVICAEWDLASSRWKMHVVSGTSSTLTDAGFCTFQQKQPERSFSSAACRNRGTREVLKQSAFLLSWFISDTAQKTRACFCTHLKDGFVFTFHCLRQGFPNVVCSARGCVCLTVVLSFIIGFDWKVTHIQQQLLPPIIRDGNEMMIVNLSTKTGFKERYF